MDWKDIFNFSSSVKEQYFLDDRENLKDYERNFE